MNWYKVKRFILGPYVMFKRYQERDKTGFIKSALELHYYRPTFYRFIDATIRNPDILYDVPARPGDIVLDVGAFVGKWAARVYEKYGCTIYAFEPDPPSLKRIEERFADNPDVHCMGYGLGARDEVMAMTQAGMGSTVYARNSKDDAGRSTVEVPVRDIAAVLDELGHDEIDVLKLNIEGGEYDVLERLIETGRLNSVRCILVQYHEWLDGAHRRRRSIRKAMRTTHEQVWDYPFVWEMWTRK